VSEERRGPLDWRGDSRSPYKRERAYEQARHHDRNEAVEAHRREDSEFEVREGPAGWKIAVGVAILMFIPLGCGLVWVFTATGR
jgi:hypothetical protein